MHVEIVTSWNRPANCFLLERLVSQLPTIFFNLCKLGFHYGVCKSSPCIPVPSQMNPVLLSCFFKTHSDTVLLNTPEIFMWFLLLTFAHQSRLSSSLPYVPHMAINCFAPCIVFKTNNESPKHTIFSSNFLLPTLQGQIPPSASHSWNPQPVLYR